ncbi:MAG: hypothetical protein AMXMBFR80_04170 [Dehalococcoidia bacterium]
MNAAVLLRAVVDEGLAGGVRGSTVALDAPSCDAIVLALGGRSLAGGMLHGIAAGPPGWDPALRDALALGLDSVCRVWGEEAVEGDVLVHAEALAAALPAGVALVIGGSAASDHGSGLLPFAIAERLGWPAIENVTAMGSLGGVAVVQVRARGGRRLTCRLPERAVLVAAPGQRLPYPAVARKLAARKAAIAEFAPAAGPGRAARWRIEGYGPARPVTRHLLRPSASANAGGRLRQLMSGGAGASSGASASLNAGEGIAVQLADLLAREGLLD